MNELGPQIALGDSIFVNSDGEYQVRNSHYEATGGKAKLAGSIEYRFPTPITSDQIRIGIFLDFGVLSSKYKDGAETRPFDSPSEIIKDDGLISSSTFRFGSGAGIRYLTPVGALRLDLAYKLTPSFTDLRKSSEVILYREGFRDTPPAERSGGRWRLHLSFDRSF